MSPVQRRLQQLETRIPKWGNTIITPLRLPAVQRQCITQWRQLANFLPTLPDADRRYCSQMWVWVRDNKPLRDPWMQAFYENLKAYYTKLFAEAGK